MIYVYASLTNLLACQIRRTQTGPSLSVGLFVYSLNCKTKGIGIGSPPINSEGFAHTHTHTRKAKAKQYQSGYTEVLSLTYA